MDKREKNVVCQGQTTADSQQFKNRTAANCKDTIVCLFAWGVVIVVSVLTCSGVVDIREVLDFICRIILVLAMVVLAALMLRMFTRK